jgi:predicted dehydrogenase
MNKVRLGILGTSWWTDIVYPGFVQVEGAEITYIAARTAEKAEKFAQEHGIPHWSGSYEELIRSPEVDAVFIGVPNFLHHEMAVKSLEAGKHVLQEKPMALSTA